MQGLLLSYQFNLAGEMQIVYLEIEKGARHESVRPCLEPERFAPGWLAFAPSVSGIRPNG
jgi:hypothetical protein